MREQVGRLKQSVRDAALRVIYQIGTSVLTARHESLIVFDVAAAHKNPC